MNSTGYMLLFCAALVVTYLVVRLNVARASSAVIVGVMINSLFFFLYAIARENAFSYALLVGVALGLVFTLLSVMLGVVFKHGAANEQVAV
jgi:hypothetical protein